MPFFVLHNSDPWLTDPDARFTIHNYDKDDIYLGSEFSQPWRSRYALSHVLATSPIFRVREEAHTYCVAESLIGTHTIHYVPTDYEITHWHERESYRFTCDASPCYQRVPWAGHGVDNTLNAETADWYVPLRHHYCHLATDLSGLIAYTRDNEAGYLDKQTRIRPGAYLKKYVPQLTDAEVQSYLAQIKSACDVELKFASTPDDIETLYRGGPSSCMSHPPGSYQSAEHPVRAYGDSDLQVAYYGDLKKASARGVVWPARKLFERLYGDMHTLKILLEKAGYVQGCMEGARIRAIWADNRDGLVLPYVDTVDMGELCDNDTMVRLDNAGDISLHRTDGVVWLSDDRDENRHFCEHCGDVEVDEDTSYCDRCAHRHWTCYDCDTESFNPNDQNTDRAGDCYCDACYAAKFMYDCVLCGEEVDTQMDDAAVRLTHHLCVDCSIHYVHCVQCDTYSDREAVRCASCNLVWRCDRTLPLPLEGHIRYFVQSDDSLWLQLRSYPIPARTYYLRVNPDGTGQWISQ